MQTTEFLKNCPRSLYVHWPFCSKKCHYCDFVAFQNHEQYQDAYHETLCGEVSSFSNMLQTTDKRIDTIFFGGGTPSLYEIPQLEEFFDVLQAHYDLSQTQEISMEVNPSDVYEEKLDGWREAGIDRLSIGVQALDDDLLFKLNRRQRITDVKRAMKLGPKYFDRMSVDLILGLPDISFEKWKSTLKEAVSWPIQHISIYFLTIHEKTPLFFKVQRGEHIPAGDNEVIKMYEHTVDFLAQHGFEQYEISNFARPGHESTHNQAYWNRLPYKGFGIGASSFDGKNRFTNHKNLETYIAQYKNPTEHCFDTQESLSEPEELMERVMLSLRQRKGLDLHHMLYWLSDEKKDQFMERVTTLKKADLLYERNGVIHLSRRGMILENEVILHLT